MLADHDHGASLVLLSESLWAILSFDINFDTRGRVTADLVTPGHQERDTRPGATRRQQTVSAIGNQWPFVKLKFRVS